MMTRFMKTWILVLLFMISAEAFSQSVSDSLIYWQSNVKLKWNDFKGQIPEPAPRWDANSLVELRTEVRASHHVPDFEVYAAFLRYGSWTRNNTSDVLLKHEQLHFDIGELYVRKMRQALNKLRSRGDTATEDYLHVFNQLAEACNEMNSICDAQTEHGVDQSQQEIWNKKIAKALFKLRKYADDAVIH